MKRINLNMHIGGRMCFSGLVAYNGGRVAKFDAVDVDIIGYFTLVALAKDSGLIRVQKMWYAYPGHSLQMVKEIFGDIQVLKMIEECEDGGTVNIYCEGEEGNVSDFNVGDHSGDPNPDISDDDSNKMEDDPDEMVDQLDEEDDVNEAEEEEEEEEEEEDQEEGGVMADRDVVNELPVDEEDQAMPDVEVNEVETTEGDVESEYEKSEEEIEDDDGESTIGERRKRMLHGLSEYNPHCDHKSIEWKAGICFETPRQLHKAVQIYAIANGYNL